MKIKKTVENEGHLINIYDFKRGNTEEVSSHFKELLIKAATVAAPKSL